jgi:hypothetical protein
VKLAAFTVMIAPNSKSLLAVVVAFPLLGDTPLPCCAAVTSSEFAVATPEYSKIAIRIVSKTVSDTVTVLAPPAMFSA